MKKYIFFDLDGTLTESASGIISSARYALKKMGIEDTDPEKEKAFIGPPLSVGFRELYGLTGEDIETAIRYHREYYNAGAYKDAPLYHGIEETLEKLQGEGRLLFIVTSKPIYLAEKVAAHFQLERFISEVVGPDAEKKSAGKAELIRKAAECVVRSFGEGALTEEEVLRDTVMVGDRLYDIEAAKEVGIPSVGVLYGYGSREELVQAGADELAEHPGDIPAILRRLDQSGLK